MDPHVVGTSLYTCDQPPDTPRLATSIGNVAAIEGESSFLVPYGTNAAVLLDRPDGAKKLRLSLVPLYASTPDHESLGVQVGNRRGQSNSVRTGVSDELMETGNHDYPLAGPLQTLEVPLPTENGDLLLEIQTPCMPESNSPSATAAWVDALTFE